ncbi:MAG TPA: exodeoxyribonuclease VII large subunit [Thauera sp.]|nr:exodeoxyribonuclease VII large subunit [Thauera sp.]
MQSAPVLTVSALNRLAREALESALPLMWIDGEISNLTRAASGHLYFTLKDASAQVRCTIWRNRAQLLAFRPENGMRVEIRALATLYEARGDYQLNVETVRKAGIGDLFEAFRRLRDTLTAEGLFDADAKRPIPRFPRAIGLVTSPAAAALRDVLVTLGRRAAHVPVILYPAPVQGADAATRLVEAVRTAGERAAQDGIEVLLLVRGGGSLEDLWSFNDEALARALRACPIPVLSGVGHETDFSIADFAADLRAPTPTGAAELASAGWHAAHREIDALGPQLERSMQRRLEALAQRLDRASLRFVHPRERLRQAQTDTHLSAARLQRAMQRQLERTQFRHAALELRLARQRPNFTTAHSRTDDLGHRLQRAGQTLLARRQAQVDALAAHLQHLNPESVLARGYAIARDAHGRVLRSATEIATEATVEVQLASGRLLTQVTGRIPADI